MNHKRGDIVSVSPMIRHDVRNIPWARVDRFPLAILLDDGVPFDTYLKYRVLFVDQIPEMRELKVGDLLSSDITGAQGEVSIHWVEGLARRLRGPNVYNKPGDTQILLDVLENLQGVLLGGES